jgi:hypothetical protein
MADASSLALALGGFTRRQNPYDLRRAQGEALLKMGSDASPILSPWQGAARLAQALTGGIDIAMANQDEKAQNQATIDSLSKLAQAKTQDEFNTALGGLKATNDSDVVAPILAQVVGQRQQQLQNATYGNEIGSTYGVPPQGAAPQGNTFSVAPSVGGGGANGNAVAGIESKGQPNNGYGAIGPVADNKGSRAVGRYGVMDYNIGPWTQEVLGKSMSPQEFLASPEAQDKVFETKFGQYVTQYGSPQAASRVWFAGPGGMNTNATDVNGMTPQRYQAQFTQNGGGGGAAPLNGGLVPPDVVRNTGGIVPIPNATGTATPTPIPNAKPGDAQTVPAQTFAPPTPTVVPRPPADPQIVQEVVGRVQRGLISRADGIKEIEANRDKNQQLLQAQADKTYAEQLGEYTTRRNIQLQGAEHDRQQNTATPNPEQALSGGFADRMARSNGIIGQIPVDVKTSGVGKAKDMIPFGVGNLLQTPAYQQYLQARSDFINAQLRRESGAAIAPSEYANADKQYFPQPGDSKEVLAQKEVNRRLAIEGMVRNAGPAYQQSPTVNAPQAIAGQGAAPQPTPSSGGVPQPAIDRLKANPSEAAQFDEIFGQGAAAKVLGR